MMFRKNVMKKFFVIFFIALLVNIVVCEVNVKAEDNKKIAIIYDYYNEYGSNENKLISLVNIILTCGREVDIIRTNKYDNVDLNKYDNLIVLCNENSQLSNDILSALSKYNRRIIWIGKNFNQLINKKEISSVKYQGNLTGTIALKGNSGNYKINNSAYISIFKIEESKNENGFNYVGSKDEMSFFIKVENLIYFPYFSYNDISYSILRKEIYNIINNTSVKDSKKYLLIDKVYPFINLNEFVSKIDFLHDNGIDFFCSIMPVYDNSDFDAMRRFTEVLKYAQDKGGKMILHYSELFGIDIPGNEVEAKMELGNKNYVKYGVYPLALDIPEEFLYKDDYKSLIQKSDTIFIDKYERFNAPNVELFTINSFKNVIEKIKVEDGNLDKMQQLNYNVAYSINADLNLESFKKEVIKLSDKNIFLNDVNYLDSTINFSGLSLVAKGQDVLLNNKSVYEKQFSPKEQVKTEDISNNSSNSKKSIDLTNTNKLILHSTFFICSAFIILAVISAIKDRQKYFK